MSGQFFGKGRRKRINLWLALLLVIAFSVSLIPQNALSYQITAGLEPPGFTSIPTIPVDQTSTSAAGAQYANLSMPADGSAPTLSTQSSNAVLVGTAALDPQVTTSSLTIPLDALTRLNLEPQNTPEFLPEDLVYLVKLKEGADEEQFKALAIEKGARLSEKVTGINIFKLSFKAADEVTVMAALAQSPEVSLLQRDLRYGPEMVAKKSTALASPERSALSPVLAGQDTTLAVASTSTPAVTATDTTQTAAVSGSTAVDASTQSAATSPATSVYVAADLATASSTDQYQAVDPTAGSVTTPVVTKTPLATDTSSAPQAAVVFTGETTVSGSQVASTDQYAGSGGNVSVAPDATIERSEVELMAAGPTNAPVEYSATVGDTGVKFASAATTGEELIDVTMGTKGFSLGFTAGSAAQPVSVTNVGSSVAYRDPATGATLTVTPDSKGLSVTLSTTSADAIQLKLPLYGLFAESNADGTIAFYDADTGTKLYEIIVAQPSSGLAASLAALSFSGYPNSVIEVVPETTVTTSESGSVATTLDPTAPFSQSTMTKFFINEIEPGINPAGLDVHFGSGSATDGILASLDLNGETIAFKAADSAQQVLTRSNKGRFTEYEGAAGAADIRFKQLPHGLEQEIALNAQPDTGVFELPISIGSLTAIKLEHDIDLLDASGIGVARISARMMHDSRPASEGGAAYSQGLSLELKTTADGQQYLEVTADSAWLSDPARIYPIFIDPDVTLNSPSTGMIVNSPTPTFWWDTNVAQTNAQLIIAKDGGISTPTETWVTWEEPWTKVIHTNYSLTFDQIVFEKDGLGSYNRFTLPATNALPEGRYYWRVFATDSNGQSKWSDPVQFYVNTTHIAGYYGSIPPQIPTGRTITVPITVINRGTSTWNATGSDRFVLSYGVIENRSGTNITYNEALNTPTGFHPLRTALPYDVPGGGQVTLDGNFIVPDGVVAGSTLTIKWDMRQEGICWFSERAERTFNMTTVAQNQWDVVYGPQSLPTNTNLEDTISMRVKATNEGSDPLDVSSSGWSDWLINNVVAILVDASGKSDGLWTLNHGVYNQPSGGQIITEITNGNSGYFDISFTIPIGQAPGPYLLRFDMNGQASWYFANELGVPTFDMPIMIGAYGVIPDVSYHKFGDSSFLNLTSGNVILGATDYKSSGRGPPIDITRTYNSLSTASGVFGSGWTSTLDVKLDVQTDYVKYHAADGAIYTFDKSDVISGVQTYIHPVGLFLTLKKLSDGSFELASQDETSTIKFDSTGRLLSAVDNNGNTVTYNYINSRIDSIDAADATLAHRVLLYYNASGQIDYIQVPSPNLTRGYSFWQYGYTSGSLTGVVFDPATDPGTSAANPGALAVPTFYTYDTVTDRLASIKFEYGADNQVSETRLLYDGQGRITNICDPRFATGTTGTSIAYFSDVSNGNAAEITNARGGKTRYELGFDFQVKRTVTSETEATFTEDFSSGLGNWMPADTNVALGASVTSSGNLNADCQASNVVDGVIDESLGSYWLAPNGNPDPTIYRQAPDFVEVDLGEQYVVSGMRFFPTHDGSSLNRATTRWRIAVSNGGATYTDVARGNLPAGIYNGLFFAIPWVEVKMSPSLVRYVRFYVDGYSFFSGGLNELQVYGSLPGAQPDASVWSVDSKILTATLPVGTGQTLISRDSYSDFSYEVPIKMNLGNNSAGLIFRETNNKTNFTGGSDTDTTGLYYFGLQRSGTSTTVMLMKHENSDWTDLKVPQTVTTPPVDGSIYTLKVEALGPNIKCYLNGDLFFDIQDFTYTRGHVGFRVKNINSQGAASYQIGDTSHAAKVYGLALTSDTYDPQRNLVGVTSALKTEVNSYDNDVFGWDAQIPENRWSLQREAENNVIYASDMDGSDAMWFGDAGMSDYTVEAKIKILEAVNNITGVAGITVRSNGDADNGYQYAITPYDTHALHVWKMVNVDDGDVLLDRFSTEQGGSMVGLGQWHTYKIKVAGSTINIYLDGNTDPIGTCTNSDLAKGKIGLFVNHARAVFDDVKIQDANGNLIKFDDFQSKGLLSTNVSIDKVSGITSGDRITYDAHSRPSTVTDQNKKRTTVTRDERGNITLVADSAGNVIARSYDSHGNLLSETAPVKPTYNSVPNPGCDSSTAWTFTEAQTSSFDPTESYDSGKSLKMYFNGTTISTSAKSTRIPVKAGDVYTLSAFVKAGGELKAQDLQNVFLRFWSDSGTNGFLGQSGPEFPLTKDQNGYGWQRISKTVVVPAGATEAEVYIALGKSSSNSTHTASAATVWVDAVQLEEGAQAPAANFVRNYDLSQTVAETGDPNWTFSTNGTSISGEFISGSSPLSKWTSLNSPNPWYVDENGELSAFNITSQTYLIKSNQTFTSPDFSAKVQMKVGLDVALTFRMQANGDMYIFRCSGEDTVGQNHVAVLQKLESGTYYTLGTYTLETMPAMDTWHDLRVNDSGTTIICSFDGADLITSVGNTAQAGAVGFRIGPGGGGNPNHHHFDDVVVDDGTTQLSDDFTPAAPVLSENHSSAGLSSAWSQDLTVGSAIPDANYIFLADVLTIGTGNGGARLHIVWEEADSYPLTNPDSYSEPFKTYGVWQTKAISVIAPVGAARAAIYLEQSDFNGTTQYRNIHFERSDAQGPYSLLGNGSFESTAETAQKHYKYPVGWTAGNPTTFEPASAPYWMTDEGTSKFGENSVRVVADYPANSYIYQDIDVKPSTTYLLSGWIKTAAVQAGSGSGTVLDIMSGDEHYITTPVTGDTDWSLQSLSFTTAPNTARITLFLRQGFDGGSSGISWFDGIELIEQSPYQSSNLYDLDGNYVTQKSDPLGTLTSYGLNTVGQALSETINQRANVGVGSPTEITTNHAYDNAGRELSVTAPPANTGGPRATVSVTFDHSGNTLTRTDAAGTLTTYTYDAGSRVAGTNGAANQIFADDFSAGAKAWTPASPNSWTLQTNGSWQGTAGNWAGELASAGSEDWKRYAVQTDVKIANGFGAGIDLQNTGTQAGSDSLFFFLCPDDDRWYLIDLTNGGWVEKTWGSYVSGYGQSYSLKAVVNESEITLYAKEASASEWGNYLWSGTCASFTHGKIGLRIWGDGSGGTAEFDNVSVLETVKSTREYDNAGFVMKDSIEHVNGTAITTYTTDGLGRALAKNEEGRITGYTYDVLGNKLTETDPLGSTTRYVYDSSGVCATFDRLGNLTSSIKARNLDNLNVSASIDARGGIAVDQSDASGVVTSTDKLTNSVYNTYSSNGSLSSRVDPRFAPYMFAYDVTGRPALFTDSLGAQTTFSRDSLGRLVTRTDGRGVWQSFTYDQNGRVLKRSDSDGPTTYYEWDYEWDHKTGNLTRATNPDLSFITYSYDQSGNLTAAEYHNGATIRSSLYDQGSYGGPGFIRDQAGGTTSYGYDVHGQLINLGSSYYAPGAGITRTYNANGNLASETYPDGSVQFFAYDAESRMTSFNLIKNGALVAGETYAYDANGNRTLATEVSYQDNFGSISSFWTPSNPSYWSQASDAGNSVYQGNNLSGAATSVFVYDPLKNYAFSAKVKINSTSGSEASAGIIIKSDAGTNNTGSNQYYFGLFPNETGGACWRLGEFTGSLTNMTSLKSGSLSFSSNHIWTPPYCKR